MSFYRVALPSGVCARAANKFYCSIVLLFYCSIIMMAVLEFLAWRPLLLSWLCALLLPVCCHAIRIEVTTPSGSSFLDAEAGGDMVAAVTVRRCEWREAVAWHARPACW